MTILKEPNPVLLRECERVSTVSDNVVDLANTMVDTMNEHEGLGLAAPQVGESLRIICFLRNGKPEIVINPEIRGKKGAQQTVEGCLSIPNKYFVVKRHAQCILEGDRLDGSRAKIRCSGELTSIVEHECDHLDGILISKRGKLIGTKNQ